MKTAHCTKLNILITLVFGVWLIVCGLNIYIFHQINDEHQFHIKERNLITYVDGVADKAPVVWIYGQHMESGYLDHVKAVFERLGFRLKSGEDDWDVLWAHDYPFVTMDKVMSMLKPHQKVNHFPGSGFITNKGSLASLKLDNFPKAFRIPSDRNELLKYADKYPDSLWVQKNNNHRGIKIKGLQEVDFDSNGTFVQEFISKPLLIDGRKFDIGVYVVLTSLSPLRVYIINDEALFRFCPKEYYPFDPADVDTYVIHDAYKPIWEIPPLQDLYINQKYSMKETFNRYMINEGKNVTKLWHDIHSIIRTLYLRKQSALMSAGAKHNLKNFFEMVRFDFMVDENMKLYLMEVNMSPNMATGRGHFKGNKRLYEHVLYNMLRVVGIASMVKNHFHNHEKDQSEMLVSDKSVSVFSDWCILPECDHSCDDLKCSLCSYCTSTQQREELKMAYLEHINKGGCLRIFPPVMGHDEALQWTPVNDKFLLSQYNSRNKLLILWFIGMCRKDSSFCM